MRKIKYDGRDLKILFTTTIISAVLFFAGIFCMLAEVRGTEVMMLAGIYVGGGLFLFSFINLLSGSCYRRRLKAYGYEFPYKKEDYNNDLQNVPCAAGASRPEAGNGGGRLLCFLYAAVFLLAVVWNVRYLVRWQPYVGDASVYVAGIIMLLDSFWGISAFLFYRQTDTQKYRNDVEAEDGRKKRKPLEKGIIEGIILLGIMVVIKILTVQLSEFMFRSQAGQDQEYLSTIKTCIDTVAVDGRIDRISDTYVAMSEGCYISDWGEPGDDVSQKIAEYLGISDFAELEDQFYTSDGIPRIYVKITDDGAYVRMDNPLRLDHGIQYPYEVGNRD